MRPGVWVGLVGLVGAGGCYAAHETAAPLCSADPPRPPADCEEWGVHAPAAVCWVDHAGELRALAVGVDECTAIGPGAYRTRGCHLEGPGYAWCREDGPGGEGLRFEHGGGAVYARADAEPQRCDALPTRDTRCGAWGPIEGVREVCAYGARACGEPGMLRVELAEELNCHGGAAIGRCTSRLRGRRLELELQIAPNCPPACPAAISPPRVTCGVPPAGEGLYEVVVNGEPVGELPLLRVPDAGPSGSCFEVGAER